MNAESESRTPYDFNPAWRRPASQPGEVAQSVPLPVAAESGAAEAPPLPDEAGTAPADAPADPAPDSADDGEHEHRLSPSVPIFVPFAAPPAEPVAAAEEAAPASDPDPEPEVIAPVRVAPPKPEARPEPSPFQPDPVASSRRDGPGLFERAVPYLAALVGLVALGSAIYLDVENRQRSSLLSAELAQLRTAVDALADEVAAQAVPVEPEIVDDGTIDALLALQDRIAALEEAARTAPARGTAPMQTQLGDGPETDCIPVGTRFVALAGETYPICLTPVEIMLSSITGSGVTPVGGDPIPVGMSAVLEFGQCRLTVLSADIEGFAELRVGCT